MNKYTKPEETAWYDIYVVLSVASGNIIKIKGQNVMLHQNFAQITLA